MNVDDETDHRWRERVESVFTIGVRDGSRAGVYWLPRTSLEDRVSSLLTSPGTQLCLDGPTGTGKSSLAETIVGRELDNGNPIGGVRLDCCYEYRVSKSSTWHSFCTAIAKQHFGEPRRRAIQSVSVGWGGVAPQLSMGVRVREPEDAQSEAARQNAYWDEFQLAMLLSEQRAIVLIDDIERATDAFMEHVADLTKKVATVGRDSQAKMILVGTGNVFARLLGSDPSLQDRVHEVTVDGLTRGKDRSDSWGLIAEGLNKVGLAHPGSPVQRGKVGGESLLNKVKEAVYDAADGLPKALNRLGSMIALDRGGGRSRNRSAPAILSVCENKIREDATLFRARYRTLLARVKSDQTLKSVFTRMLADGASRRFSAETLIQTLGSTHGGEYGIRTAIAALEEQGLVICTGLDNDTIYFSDPTFMHSLCTVARRPKDFGLDERLFADIGQAMLPLDGEVPG